MRENSPISGVKRYENEICSQCSKSVDVIRCQGTANKLKMLVGYQPGEVTHITTQHLAFLKTLKRVKNCVVTVHDIIPHIWYDRRRQIKEFWILNELWLNRADMFITISEYTKSDLIKHFKIEEDRIKVVHLGVDHSVFYPRNKEECRQHFGMTPNGVYLLGISSGLPWKNTEIFEKIPFNIIDTGYGRGIFGTITEESLAMLYSACDAFLAPSKAEGFCLPAVEAMSCGCPVIASNCTALPEIVGTGGVLVDPDDPAQWTEAISDVLGSKDHYSKRAVAKAACYSWEKCGKETVEIYKQML